MCCQSQVAISEQYLIPKALREGGLSHDATAQTSSDSTSDSASSSSSSSSDATQTAEHSTADEQQHADSSSNSSSTAVLQVPDTLKITTDAVESLVR
jgi:hypothetical protein